MKNFECFDGHCLNQSSQHIYQISKANIVIPIFVNMRKYFQKDWMTCPGVQAHVPNHKRDCNRTSDSLVWGSIKSWAVHSVFAFSLKVFKFFMYHVYNSRNIPLLISEAILFFLLTHHDSLCSALCIVNAQRGLMHRSEYEKCQFGNKERVTPFWSYWQKKASGNQGEKPKGKLSILVNNLQITHIKYFAADAPENQGEIHISVDNNRKNNTVIPQPSRSAPKYES